MIPTLGILYLAVVGVIVSGLIYISFAEVFKSGIKIKLQRSKISKGGSDGGKKKKKKATASKTKT
ncbi:hypothetical protein EWF20_02550 [Sulfolobus sp. S-194]|uniref:hypothetical protein n=1 Tax=Sulfolobus sp. S-194 TaxID=2512240 RepID=UPI0014370F48|nr:hypothetical protein [Sulfolobus sp. S-194]QIW23141.1 hypothetical protein EWF20_02550 [Sulfolobus sp. S-194]